MRTRSTRGWGLCVGNAKAGVQGDWVQDACVRVHVRVLENFVLGPQLAFKLSVAREVEESGNTEARPRGGGRLRV